MANNLYNTMYNPDVLSCIANLSNDEVFTPPEVANAMLDMLPQELFKSPDTTFLDPACKAVFFCEKLQSVCWRVWSQLFRICWNELTMFFRSNYSASPSLS